MGRGFGSWRQLVKSLAMVNLLVTLVSGRDWSGDLPRARFVDAEHDQFFSRNWAVGWRFAATARTWAQRTGPSSSKNGLISALERPRPTHSNRLRSGSTTTVAYRWPFWIANSSIASSRTPSRFGGPSERSRCR